MAASERDIRPGDTVRLKTGSPRMTVLPGAPKDGLVRIALPSGADLWIHPRELEHAPAATPRGTFLDSIWSGTGLG